MYFCGVKRLLLLLALCVVVPVVASEPVDTLYRDIERVEIVTSLKGGAERRAPVSTTTMYMRRLEERGVTSVKELSALAPNFYQPDYGSSITSSIYVRGFGSRIDQPVVGVIVDDVPLMNKNAYDFDFYDIRRLELLRGPQGTLYGRNTSGGVMNITTLSPLGWQGFRAMAEYSTLTSYRASASYYARPKENFGVSVAAYFNHDGGHFENTYRDEMCDRGNSGSARVRMQWLLGGGWSLDNALAVGYTREGGYAYHHYDAATGVTEAVAYNDPSGYERLTINEGFVAKYKGDKVQLTSVTSYQYLDDMMTLDQDFSSRSMFTMQQIQREHTITEEIVVRNADGDDRWQWLSGAFLFAKWLDMSSPVRFKEDGINDLILGNINKGLHTVFPENNMLFGTDSFVINSDFNIPTYGAALYHQSQYKLGRWTLTAGVRVDVEHTAMDYDSNATVPYCFDLTMTDFRDLRTEFKGREEQLFVEVLPKVAAEYRMGIGTLYGTIARGYKSGGFNTQIFSDILQVRMMNDMFDELGIKLQGVGGASYNTAEATRYKPETSWNFEVGGHLSPVVGLDVDVAAFWIECFDQQVTVLPEGNNTGRMMSNAARARSFGVELGVEYGWKGLTLRGDYGYTNARFREYLYHKGSEESADDATIDYAGMRIPYSPEHTAAVAMAYSWAFDHPTIHQLTIGVDWRGVGSIYWNEANTLYQPFYATLGAQVALRMNRTTLTLWGRNLTNTDYNVFYFKSVGEEFYSKGRPLQVGVKLSFNI